MTGPAKPAKGAYFIVAMLFFFMFVNFADKAILGLTAVPMMKELNLTPKEFGLVGSSFFLLFSISTIVVGFLVNRIQAKWALFVMSLIWALAQFPILGTTGLATLIASRIVLGAGEGPAYPVAVHAAYKWFPDEKRAVPTAFIAQGASIGVIIALPALGWVVTHYSWRWAYGVLGVVGLVWCVAWAIFGREGELPVTVKAQSGRVIDRVSYWRLIFNPTILGNIIASFGAYWGLSLLVAWFTPYLEAGLGIEASHAHLISALPWAVSALFVIFISWFSQRLMLRGVTTRLARGVLAGACVTVGGLALVTMPYVDWLPLKVALVVIGISVPSAIYVLGPAVISEITPPTQRGALLAINNATVTTAGLIAPFATGSAIQNAATPAAGYVYGFFVCGIITLVGGLIGMIFIRPAAEIRRFEADARAAPQAAAAE
ncbi:MAG: MFS transporter [Hyphomicrobiales bacterium]|nr:MFS transporter [Hyphomicrobiales bacterium]